VVARSIDLPHRASQPRAAPETAGEGTALPISVVEALALPIEGRVRAA
jgi:hypothetical protein